MATPPSSAQLNRNINVTTHSYNSIGDTDVHAMRKDTRMKQREKRGNEAERIRPRETRRATTGIVVNCSFCGKTHDRGKCPAWGRKCRVCQGLNHFAAKCRKLKIRRDVKTVETEQYGVSSLKDDSATQHTVTYSHRVVIIRHSINIII